MQLGLKNRLRLISLLPILVLFSITTYLAYESFLSYKDESAFIVQADALQILIISLIVWVISITMLIFGYFLSNEISNNLKNLENVLKRVADNTEDSSDIDINLHSSKGTIKAHKLLESIIDQTREDKISAQEASEAKSMFLANMSHEIRTPMNAIIGASELLRDDALSKIERNEFTNILNTSSKELLDLFNRILELSQLESGSMNFHESEISVHTLFIQLYSIFEQNINDSQKNLILNFTEDLQEIKIFTDLDKLTKVLSYLLENAVKFTEKGEIDFGCAIQDRNNILFYVKDTGPGINKNEQEQIFKKFTQVDNSYTRIYSGAGLGLSLCKEIVNFLGGKLFIDSHLGQGSIFYFTIPLKYSESNIILKEKIEAILKLNINDIYSLSTIKKNIAI